MNWAWLAILVLAGAALLCAFVLFMVLLFRHLHSSRQLLHTERMRSLEAGIPLEAPGRVDDAGSADDLGGGVLRVTMAVEASRPGKVA